METYSNLEKLSNDLKNLFQNQNQNQNQEESYFDFEIICEQNKISFKTHKSILSSRSEYFKNLFKSKMKEYQENKLILQDVSSSILFPILNYFYSGKIEINLENAIEILFFSSKYLIDELIEICSNFIKNNLQIETIVDILKLSEAMNFNQLLDSSYQFILDNFKEFIKTLFFLGLEENHLNSILSNDEIIINEFELFQSIIKWGKHKLNINHEKEIRKETLQNQISNIIDKIRFIDFSEQELEDTLKEDLIPNQTSQKLFEFQNLQNQNNTKKLNQFIEKENSLIFQPRFKLDSEIIQSKEHIKKLKEWINDDDFFSKMKKGFSAKRDGFSSKTWHKAVDDKGKTLVIIKTKDNFIFGGFTQIGFFPKDRSKWSRDYTFRNYRFGRQNDPNAFIFSLRNDENDRKPEKFTIKQDQKLFSIFSHLDYGPYFGCGQFFGYGNDLPDFCLYSDFNKPGLSNFGHSYNLPNEISYESNEADSYLAGSFNEWVIDELETYFI
ncbi:pep-cterm sorting domain-containing protein [Anaeramoeba ignava]|uniref:Pep-cterm sorting domain-containing protein n=1 Tax=Anaeramoeba ignava TaxID=1746090 RepID=A0A9Q0LZD4_ANAIG|nr:pep-cterm sorting domain-containing protein [Anaeramoeba ignava]